MTIISVTDQLTAALATIDEERAALVEKEKEVTLKIDVDDGGKKDKSEEADDDKEDGDDDEETADDDEETADDDEHMQHHKSLEKRLDRLEDGWAEFMKLVMKDKADNKEEQIIENNDAPVLVGMSIQLSGAHAEISEAVSKIKIPGKVVVTEREGTTSLNILAEETETKAIKMLALEGLVSYMSSANPWTTMDEAEIVIFDDNGDVVNAIQIATPTADMDVDAPVGIEPSVEAPMNAEEPPMFNDPERVVDIEAALDDDEGDDFVADEPEIDSEVSIDVEVEDDDFIDVEVEDEEKMTVETNENYSVRNKKSKAPVGKMHKTEAEAQTYLDGLENKAELEVVDKETLEKDFKKDEGEQVEEGVAAILSFGDVTNPEYKNMLMKILGKDVEAAQSKLDNLGHK